MKVIILVLTVFISQSAVAKSPITLPGFCVDRVADALNTKYEKMKRWKDFSKEQKKLAEAVEKQTKDRFLLKKDATLRTHILFSNATGKELPRLVIVDDVNANHKYGQDYIYSVEGDVEKDPKFKLDMVYEYDDQGPQTHWYCEGF